MINKLRELTWEPSNESVHEQLSSWISSYQFELKSLCRDGSPFLGHWEADQQAYQRASKTELPEAGSANADVIDRLVCLTAGSIDWTHPANAIAPCAPTTLMAIFANIISNHLSPNLAWDVYAQKFSVVELELVAMLSHLVGYDASRAAGFGTYGGAGTVLYGVRVGVEKALIASGASRSRVKLFKSARAHNSTNKAAAWLGLSENAVVEVASSFGRIDYQDLRTKLIEHIEAGNAIGCVVAEVGTTYDFALDDAAVISEICRDMHTSGLLSYVPHIHADAAIGGLYAMFNGYNFDEN